MKCKQAKYFFGRICEWCDYELVHCSAGRLWKRKRKDRSVRRSTKEAQQSLKQQNKKYYLLNYHSFNRFLKFISIFFQFQYLEKDLKSAIHKSRPYFGKVSIAIFTTLCLNDRKIVYFRTKRGFPEQADGPEIESRAASTKCSPSETKLLGYAQVLRRNFWRDSRTSAFIPTTRTWSWSRKEFFTTNVPKFWFGSMRYCQPGVSYRRNLDFLKLVFFM